MTTLTTGELLDRERNEHVISQNGGEPVVEFTPTKETAPAEIGDVLLDLTNVVPANAFHR